MGNFTFIPRLTFVAFIAYMCFCGNYLALRGSMVGDYHFVGGRSFAFCMLSRMYCMRYRFRR